MVRPRVFDDAALCPAKAAVALRGWQLPAAVTQEPLPPMGGAWLAAANLLRELANLGPTSAFVAGAHHPVTDLDRLAASVLYRERTGVREFAVAAVDSLLEAQAATATPPFDHHNEFIKTRMGSGEAHAGGAFAFAGPDGIWQLWRLRMANPREVDETSRGWAVTAAYVLASHLDREGKPRLHAVQVFEVGAVTGHYTRLGKWSRSTLEAEFDALRNGRLHDLAGDLRVVPGSHCASCPFVGACPGAPRVVDLLTGVALQPTVRKIAASDLRTYAGCPRRYELKVVDGLPAENLKSEPVERGRRLDAWLRRNHSQGRACSQDDVQQLHNETGDDAAAAMAVHHLGICPYTEASTSELAVELDVTALDATSRALLVARPDGRFLRDGKAVWRESKTRSSIKTTDARLLVETDITAALYLVLLASEVAGAPDALEWEELSTNEYQLTVLPADDRDLVRAAQMHVSSAVADLVSETAFPARVGVGCATCPARHWCPDAP